MLHVGNVEEIHFVERNLFEIKCWLSACVLCSLKVGRYCWTLKIEKTSDSTAGRATGYTTNMSDSARSSGNGALGRHAWHDMPLFHTLSMTIFEFGARYFLYDALGVKGLQNTLGLSVLEDLGVTLWVHLEWCSRGSTFGTSLLKAFLVRSWNTVLQDSFLVPWWGPKAQAILDWRMTLLEWHVAEATLLAWPSCYETLGRLSMAFLACPSRCVSSCAPAMQKRTLERS